MLKTHVSVDVKDGGRKGEKFDSLIDIFSLNTNSIYPLILRLFDLKTRVTKPYKKGM